MEFVLISEMLKWCNMGDMGWVSEYICLPDMHTLDQIRKWAGGEWLSGGVGDMVIKTISIDTRTIEQGECTLFVAIKTALRDGHDYVADAYKRGVRAFVVSGAVDADGLAGASVVVVKDTLMALQQVAAGHRKLYKIPVLAVTGSNGKTIVKEWLYQLLADDYNIVRSPKSYNSQLGVPLSVWQIAEGHQMAIIEAGISQTGEMERLERIVQPTLGIFTNIGAAHNDGFVSMRQKVNEKLSLFRHVEQLIYCVDHTQVNECVGQMVHQMRSAGAQPTGLFTWSRKQEADLRVTHVSSADGRTSIDAVYKGHGINIVIPFVDEASIENAIHCWCYMLLLGVDAAVIAGRMAHLQPVSMRLEMKQGINDCTIINDVYNSDITSVQLALNYLALQGQHVQKTVIMSDILQPGKSELDLYEEVAASVVKRGIQRFIGIGPALYKYKASFRKHKKLRSVFFKSTSQFIQNFHLLTFNKDAILLKGARVFAFEQLGVLLEQKIHQTVMSIDLSAMKHNLDVFRSHLQPGVKTMAMVKAFAYGSGSFEIGSALQYAGIDYLAVAYTDEGVALRRAGIRLPIMVMSPDTTSFDRMIAWKLEPELYNFRSLHQFVEIAKALGVTAYPVHIKLDTGMHRLGFNDTDMPRLKEVLVGSKQVKVASVFSHLAAADDAKEDEYTKQQAALFDSMCKDMIAAIGYSPIRHLCNSAAIARHKQLHYDMVRLGVGLYGVDSSNTLGGSLKLISTLKTSIAQIRTVAKGENVSYGHKTITSKETRLATICIGYADGYPRDMGNGNGYVLVNGKPAPTVGSICMDMCMVDISDIDGVQEGDEVLVFGNELPVELLAKWRGTISYEIMTSISQRVKRVYLNE